MSTSDSTSTTNRAPLRHGVCPDCGATEGVLHGMPLGCDPCYERALADDGNWQDGVIGDEWGMF